MSFWPRGKAEVRTEVLHSNCRPHERVCFLSKAQWEAREWNGGLTQPVLGVHPGHRRPDCGRMSRKAPHFCLE